MGGPGGRARAALGIGLALFVAVVVAAILVNSRSEEPPSTGTPTTATTRPDPGARTALPGFGEALVTVTSADGDMCEVCLLLADSGDLRSRGLMEVTDLGGYDGMLFRYDEATNGAFWMRNTPMALSIAFFDEQGSFVSAADMAPCPDETPDQQCPRYRAGGGFLYAVEVPLGGLDDLLMGEGSTLQVTADRCPAELRR